MATETIDFRQFGGSPFSPKKMTALKGAELKDAIKDDNPDRIMWNFGIDLAAPQRKGMSDDQWSSFQDNKSDKMMAKLPLKDWDGKSPTFRMAMTKKIKHHGTPGEFLPAQFQPNGTCVGRGASGALNVFEALLCLSGFPMIWNPVSHAWCYAGARMQYNDLGTGDGAVGKGAFEFCAEHGVTHQIEAGDTDYYKDGLAVKWARTGIPSDILALGKDNPITDAFPVTTVQKACDVLFSGGAVTVASSRGFTTTRDNDGFCKPSGTWMHQMHFVDIIVLPNGRKGLACVQSWGEDAQKGPKLEQQPGYVFGVDMDVAESMLRQGDSMGCMNFEPWLEDQPWLS